MSSMKSLRIHLLIALVAAALIATGCGVLLGQEFDAGVTIDTDLYRIENLRCEHQIIGQRLEDDSVVEADSYWARGEVVNISDDFSQFWTVGILVEFSDGFVEDQRAATDVPPMATGEREEFSALIRTVGEVGTHDITPDDVTRCEVVLYDSVFNW